MKLPKKSKADSKKLAEQYHVDASRVADILAKTRITENWNPIAGYRYVEKKVRDRARYWPLLEDALEDMGPKALDLFETDPPDVLSNRLMWLYRLMWHDLPVYTREGLIRLTEAFVNNQEDNKEHLIATGYRNKVMWEKFPWLDERLGNLYPTKPYESFAPVLEKPGELSFSWATLDSGGSKVQCSYKEAPIFDVLDTEQSQYIEQLRPELFDLKVIILRRLLAILKAGPLDDPENQNFKEILSMIQEHDIGVLILTDNMLSGKGRVPNSRPGGRKRTCYPGGMTGIIDVAKHYITEAQTGFYHETKEFLWPTFIEDRDGNQKFNSTPFAVMREADPGMIKRKLDGLCKGLIKSSDCLDNLDLIVLGNDELMVRLKGDGLSVALKNHLKSTRDSFLFKPKYADAEIPNRFLKDGDYWFIKYKSKEIILRGLVGLCCIAHILIRQSHGIDAGNLLALCGTKADYTHETSIESVDKKTIQQTFTKQLKLKNKINKLRNEEPDIDVTELEIKHDALDNYLKENARWIKDNNGDMKPVPKHIGGDNTGANDISKNLDRAYKALDKSHKVLSNHLRKYIKRHKFKFYYEPEPEIEWNVNIG